MLKRLSLVVSILLLFPGAALVAAPKKVPRVKFLIQVRAAPGPLGRFYVRTSDPAVIAKARAQLRMPIEKRNLHVNGGLGMGTGGFNQPWAWHIVDNKWGLAEMSVEVCDGRPIDVEKGLDYWVNTVKHFCPWTSYVAKEVK